MKWKRGNIGKVEGVERHEEIKTKKENSEHRQVKKMRSWKKEGLLKDVNG